MHVYRCDRCLNDVKKLHIVDLVEVTSQPMLRRSAKTVELCDYCMFKLHDFTDPVPTALPCNSSQTLTSSSTTQQSSC
jgi:hypothetical protein